MAKSTSTKAETNNATHVVAIIEKKKFNPRTGQRESKPFRCTFTPSEWAQFQQVGWRQGWFVESIQEAPEGTDLSYKNPE